MKRNNEMVIYHSDFGPGQPSNFTCAESNANGVKFYCSTSFALDSTREVRRLTRALQIFAI